MRISRADHLQAEKTVVSNSFVLDPYPDPSISYDQLIGCLTCLQTMSPLKANDQE